MSQFLKDNKKYVITALLLITLCVVAAYSIFASLAVASLGLSFILISRLSKHLGFSTIFGIVVAIVFYAFILQFGTLAIWFFNKNAPLDTAIPLTFAALLITTLLISTKKTKAIETTSQKKGRFGLHDLLSIIAGVFFVLVIISPVNIRFNGLPVESAIGFVDGNVDDAAHIGAVTDRIEYNRGVFLKSDHAMDVRSLDVSAGSYPPGWHSVNAVLARAFLPDMQAGSQTLWFYVFSKIFWFSVLVILFFRFGFFILSLLKTKVSIFASLLFTAMLTLFTYYFLIDTFRLGSYTFVPQLISVVLLGIILLSYRKSMTMPEQISTLALAAVFGMGGGITWILTLPVIGFILVLLAYEHLHGPIKVAKQFLLGSLRYLPLYLMVLFATLTQLWMIRSTESGAGIVESLNAYGYISRYNEIFLIVIVLSVAAFAFITHRNKSSNKLRSLIITFLAALLTLSASIYVLQLTTIEQINYYFYKSLNVFYVVAIPIAIATLAHLWSHAQTKFKMNKLGIGLFAVTSLLLIIGFPAGDSPTVSYLSGKLGLSKSASEYTYNYIDHSQQNSNRYTFYFNPDDTANTDLATMLLKSVPVDSTCYGIVRPSFIDHTPPKDISKILAEVCSDENITILTTHKWAREFNTILQELNISNVSLEEIIVPIHTPQKLR